MGGYGSGRPGQKRVVEDMLSIDSRHWARRKIVGQGRYASGIWQWSRDEEVIASIGYASHCDQEPRHVRLTYTWDKSRRMDYVVRLTTTKLYRGGRRWWFECPARGCGRRVAKLYCVGGLFVCRSCGNLTYQSCKDAHKYDSIFGVIEREMGYSAKDMKRALGLGGGW